MHITSLGEILPASLYRDTRSKVELGHSTKATWQHCIESISFCMSVLYQGRRLGPVVSNG